VSTRAGAAATLYALGALLLLAEGAVHVQQFAAIFHDVRWIGPLFLGNAAACVAAAAGLANARTRPFAAAAGVAISALALGGLVMSYGHGVLGWQEAGWRIPIELAVIAEAGAAVVLAAALAASPLPPSRR
jgi:hypothetical protein